MASPMLAINDLLENALKLGHANEVIQQLHEERIARLEDHFRGNGESVTTRLRLLVTTLQHLEERQETAGTHAEELLRIQIAQLEQRREDALREATKDMQRQLDVYGNELARVKKSLEEERGRKWDVIKILLAWVLGAGITVLVQLLLKK